MIPLSFSLFTRHERSAQLCQHSSTYSGTLNKADLFILHPAALRTNRWFSSIAFYSYFILADIYCVHTHINYNNSANSECQEIGYLFKINCFIFDLCCLEEERKPRCETFFSVLFAFGWKYLPSWTALIFIPFGLWAYIIGLRWYKLSLKIRRAEQ